MIKREYEIIKKVTAKLTPLQKRYCDYLASRGRATNTEIGRHFGVARHSSHEILKKLMSMGLVGDYKENPKKVYFFLGF